jgi:hypothetical protein
MNRPSHKAKRIYNPIKHTIALPPDVADLGQIDWYQPPTAAELLARYETLNQQMDAERAARVLAVELILAAERGANPVTAR